MVGASTFPTVEAFYADDERRRRSPELDYGVWWEHRGVRYRITWVDATGELIAVQLTPPRAIPMSVLRAELDAVHVPVGFAETVAGLVIFGGDPETVTVIGIVRGRNLVEQLLDGWAEACGKPDSLAWVLERLEGAAP